VEIYHYTLWRELATDGPQGKGYASIEYSDMPIAWRLVPGLRLDLNPYVPHRFGDPLIDKVTVTVEDCDGTAAIDVILVPPTHELFMELSYVAFKLFLVELDQLGWNVEDARWVDTAGQETILDVEAMVEEAHEED